MDIDLVASTIGSYSDDEDSYEVVALADNPDSPAWSLSFQRGLYPTPSEVELGLDGYCITTLAGRVSYNCLETATMSGSTLVLRFTEAGQADLGVPGGVAVRIEVPEAELRNFVAQLEAILSWSLAE